MKIPNLAGAAFGVTDTDVHAIAHYKIESIDFSHMLEESTTYRF